MLASLQGLFSSAPKPELLDEKTFALVEQCVEEFSRNTEAKLGELTSVKTITALDAESRAKLVCYLVDAMRILLKEDGYGNHSSSADMQLWLFRLLSASLMRKRLPFSEEQLYMIARTTRKCWRNNWFFPLTMTAKAAETFSESNKFESQTIEEFKELARHCSASRESGLRKVGHRIFHLFDEKKEPKIAKGWQWVDDVFAEWAALSSTDQQAWSNILAHAATATSARPSKKWLKTAEGLIAEAGSDFFTDIACRFLNRIVGAKFDTQPLAADMNATLVKGVVWASAAVDNAELVNEIHSLGEYSFRKIRGYGAASSRVGNAVIFTLSALPGVEAISKLTALREKVKYQQAQTLIEKALARAAEERGLSVDTLEELAVPDHELGEDGSLSVPIDEYSARATLGLGGKMSVTWLRPDGKSQKTAPKSLRDNHADAIAAFRREVKQVSITWRGQCARVERLMLYPNTWPFEEWCERYRDHGLMRHMTCRLVWEFCAGASTTLAMWYNGEFIGSDGSQVDIPTTARVDLWHPIGSNPSVVLGWRRFLEANDVTQPFKQAHREIYLLTDAERSTSVYSNRFAGHILRQHQLASLCKERGWDYQLQGQFDSWSIPTRGIAGQEVAVEFYCEATDGPTSDAGIFLYVSTDQVRFVGVDGQPLPLDSIEERIFSELLRDVDLFVGVCSVGNDPNWQDQGLQPGYGDYWQSFAFGDLNESAKIRHDVLAGLLPKLKIASRCVLDGRYLVVRGDIRTYRIHIGSGNIQMEPNNQYLCIVQDNAGRAAANRLRLPFEGDGMLSVIISKAVLLANDSKIKDRTILSQIKRLR
ncbi:MAG: DUF4132 domain-containing protein [Woeseiaceae bacterium]